MPCLDDIVKHYANPRTTSISMISNAAGVPVGDPALSRVFKIPYNDTLNLDNNNGTRMPYYPRTLTHW